MLERKLSRLDDIDREIIIDVITCQRQDELFREAKTKLRSLMNKRVVERVSL